MIHALLIALAGLAPSPVASPVPVTPAQVGTARTALENGLRDYAGSRFRGFRAVRTPAPTGPRLTLCGEANARNAMGGLTGWVPIAVVVEGDRYAPAVYMVENGLEGLTEFAQRCPYGTGAPKGAEIGADDLTPALIPTP